MRKGETSRFEEFWRNQESFDSGIRIVSGDRAGFIIDWNITGGLPLRGRFSVLYDCGDYREYDVFYFRHIRGVLDPASRWLNNPRTVKDSYKRYCENLFLGKLIDEE